MRFLLLALLSANVVWAETPAGLQTLGDDRVLSSPERNWQRLGIRTWELRDLERVRRENGVEAWHVAFTSQDLSQTAYMARPTVRFGENGKPEQLFPAIILCHGSSQGVTPAYRAVAWALAERGYVVAAPTFRGQRGLAGFSQGSREYQKGEVLDVFQLTQLVRKLAYVDPRRMAIIGEGHGGGVAAQVIGRSNVFSAAVLLTPALLTGSGDYGYAGLRRFKNLAFEIFGRNLSDGEIVRELAARDAFRFASRVTTPTLIIAAGDSPYPEEVQQWSAAVRRSGAVTELVTYPGMGPNFMTEVGGAGWPAGRREARDSAWRNVFTWIENYAPPNAQEVGE